MQVRRLPGGPWGQNAFVISRAGAALLIDPGGGADDILAHLRSSGLRLRGILNTHGHFDHVGAVDAVVIATLAPFFISGKEAQILKSANLLRFIFRSPDRVVIPEKFLDLDVEKDNLRSELGFDIRAIPTPGHTPGGYCFLIEDRLFGGDTVLPHTDRNTKLPGGDASATAVSLAMLGALPPDLTLHPGHGRDMRLGDALRLIRDRPTTSVGA
jgi:hydroxyacylglutathione hydrolase